MHEFWMQTLGINGSYEAFDIPQEYLVQTIKKTCQIRLQSGNITVPHKEKALLVCDEVSAAAKKIGAVNTLVFENNKIIGDNTDYAGFELSLPKKDYKEVLVLGAGGAARAIVFALKNLNADVTIANRSFERAEKLGAEFDAEFTSWEAAEKTLGDYDLIVNTTSLGMKGNEPLKLNFSSAKKSSACDIVFNPLETTFLKDAKSAG